MHHPAQINISDFVSEVVAHQAVGLLKRARLLERVVQKYCAARLQDVPLEKTVVREVGAHSERDRKAITSKEKCPTSDATRTSDAVLFKRAGRFGSDLSILPKIEFIPALLKHARDGLDLFPTSGKFAQSSLAAGSFRTSRHVTFQRLR